MSSSSGSRRVLSIQSHVVSGYVGNKAATFPLQLLGYEVDVLNTVQFSNHLGYGHHGGGNVSVDHLISCIDALDQNGLLTHEALLTGFTPGPEGIDALKYSLEKIKSNNPDLVYLVDPVMGDDGKLYVSAEVPPKYKALLALATVATPNEFEAQILTGIQTRSIVGIRHCLQAFHETYSIPHVVITSISLPLTVVAHLSPVPDADADGNILVCVGSTRGETEQPWIIVFPKRKETYSGVGDLFASVLLGRLLADPSSQLSRAAEFALSTTQGVLDRTAEMAQDAPAASDRVPLQAVRVRAAELKLIQSRGAIEAPVIRWKAMKL